MGYSPKSFMAQVDLAGRSVFAEKNFAVPAGAGTYVVKGAPGRVFNLLVTTVGTGNDTTIYDNADGAASGTILAQIAGTTAANTQVTISMPAENGITVVNGADAGAVTIGYS